MLMIVSLNIRIFKFHKKHLLFQNKNKIKIVNKLFINLIN